MTFLKLLPCKRFAGTILSIAAFLIILMTAQQANAQDMDQWQNTDNQWANGNINNNNSDYTEGDSIPYRVIYSVTGTGPHTISIEWDSVVNSNRHSIDYLTTWNASDNPVPCLGVICGPGSSTFAIPTDPVVTAGFNGVDDAPAGPTGGDDIAQLSGVFTLFGGTITGVGSSNGPNTLGYNNANPFLADKTNITITFTTTGSTTVVLAFGGHLARQDQWGFNHSAGTINGANYHMRLSSGGGGALSATADAVTVPASITIVQDTNPNSAQNFSFSAAGLDLTSSNCFSPSAGTFLLDDDADPTLLNTCTFTGISSNFGTTRTVTQSATAGWNLTGLGCFEQTPSGVTNTATTTAGTTSSIRPDEGEVITCTYTNSLAPTAGNVTLTGRVLTESGAPIRGAVLTLYNANTLETQVYLSSSLGYFTFKELPVNHFYILTVSHGKYYFPNNMLSFTMLEDLTEVNFVSSDGTSRSTLVTGRKGGR